jgi:hypothetical protein
MIRAYKIVEIVDGQIKTLFHGLNGSRTMPRGVWLDAVQKQVKDGTSKTTYLSGWHVFLTQDDAFEYIDRFTKRIDFLQVVECWIETNGLRSKDHSPAPVMLAKRIMF